MEVLGRLYIGEHDELGTIPTRGSILRSEDGSLVAESLDDAHTQAALRLMTDELGPGRWALLFQISWLVEPHLTRRPIPAGALDIDIVSED